MRHCKIVEGNMLADRLAGHIQQLESIPGFEITVGTQLLLFSGKAISIEKIAHYHYLS
jgi:hypothetical protein